MVLENLLVRLVRVVVLSHLGRRRPHWVEIHQSGRHEQVARHRVHAGVLREEKALNGGHEED